MAKKVLVVDDDKILLLRIKKECKKYINRFSMLFAENGLEAVDILKKDNISLVVTDLQMPEMDGFKLLAHLSNNYPDIPVIIQTASSSPHFKRAVLEGGAVEYIDLALKCVKDSGGVVHFYHIGSEPDPFKDAIEVFTNKCVELGYECDVVNKRIVHDYAPRMYKVRVDFYVKKI